MTRFNNLLDLIASATPLLRAGWAVPVRPISAMS